MLRAPVAGLIPTVRAVIQQHRSAWRKGPLRRRLGLVALAILMLGALLPWPITVTGPFVAAPLVSLPHVAPDSGIVVRVQVLEGTRVAAGAPLVQIRNLEMERELAVSRRVSDSLAALSTRARGLGRYAQVALLDAERSIEEARVAGLRERVEALRLRALGSGVVVTPRTEELVGSWVSNGERVIELGQADSVEIRIVLDGAGATLIRVGSPVRLLREATLDAPVRGRVTTLSATANSSEAMEARLKVPAADSWRPGMTGWASITLRQSNLWGALWWGIRRGVRSDILL
jgi:multidrug efflux pump subunit AcrA (membrane-fusion protein)